MGIEATVDDLKADTVQKVLDKQGLFKPKSKTELTAALSKGSAVFWFLKGSIFTVIFYQINVIVLPEATRLALFSHLLFILDMSFER